MTITGIIEEKIEMLEGVEVSIEKDIMTISGPNGSLSRTFKYPKIDIKKENNVILISCKLPRRREKAMVGTFRAHINNMIKGVTRGFEYKMKVVYSHFPIKTSVKERTFIVENFLGAKYPRKANIVGDAKVVIKGDEITVTSINKEDAGQTAANIEQATSIRKLDPRVFQEGIYIIQKGGKS